MKTSQLFLLSLLSLASIGLARADDLPAKDKRATGEEEREKLVQAALSDHIDQELSKWTLDHNDLTPVIKDIFHPQTEIAGEWAVHRGLDGSSLIIRKTESGGYSVDFSTGGCLLDWDLKREGTFKEGIFHLNKPVKEYLPMTYDTLYAVSVGGKEYLISQDAIRFALKYHAKKDVVDWQAHIDFLAFSLKEKEAQDPKFIKIDLNSPSGKALIPPEPYKIVPGDSLRIRMMPITEKPIDGVFVVEPKGTVSLGSDYGQFKVEGISLASAEENIKKELAKVLREPDISVTLVGWRADEKSRSPAAQPRNEQEKNLHKEKPPESFKFAVGDAILIQAKQALPSAPIDGIYLVEPMGTIAIGPDYGRVKVEGLSLAEAKAAVEKKLTEVLLVPEVSLTLAGWVERIRPEKPCQPYRIAPGDILDIWASFWIPDEPILGHYLVEPDGQVSLGACYGRVTLKDHTLEEAEKIVIKKLSEILRNPEVSITFAPWRELRKPPTQYRMSHILPSGELQLNKEAPKDSKPKSVPTEGK
jgi:protein involved in polysaccharide export with SLBB domain